MGRMASPRRTPIPSTPNERPAMSEAITKATDEQIRTTVESIRDPDTVPAFSNGYYTLTPDELRRAILALRPAVEPIPERDVVDAFCKEPHRTQYVSVFFAGVRFAEAHHGITAKAEDAHQPTKEAEK